MYFYLPKLVIRIDEFKHKIGGFVHHQECYLDFSINIFFLNLHEMDFNQSGWEFGLMDG